MIRPITRLTLSAAIAAMAVSLAAPMAMAQGKPGQNGCIVQSNGQTKCDQPQAKGQSQGQAKGQPQAQAKGQPQAQAKGQPQAKAQAQKAPAVGESARRGAVVQQAKHSRLPAPPSHQHYRVVDDKIVRVDDKTLAIVAIVGLASSLLNN